MGKIIKLGMVFEIGNVPDFGSIEAGQDGALTLLEEDVGKLNSALTRAACLPMLAQGCTFSIPGGTNAVVADQPAVWRYHAESDRWYELISGDSDEHRVYFYSGNVLMDSQTVDDGGTAVYGGVTPVKAETERYTYSFAGWNADPGAVSADSDALKNVTANRTVYAVFTASEKTFTVTFKNNTETVYTASSVAYDTAAVYGGETPTKESDEQYSYTFAGWNADPEAEEPDSDALKNVKADRTVYAIFAAEPIETEDEGDGE